MGKDWYYWAGTTRSSKRGVVAEAEAESQAPPSGCMCSAVFHLFDFHPFHFPSSTTINQQQQQNTFKEDIASVPKGAEAPRNSLESEDGTTSSSVFTKEDEQEEPFKIAKKIEIKTRTSGGNLNDLSSLESPAKTPTLVARLMGLDLLPGSDSPSSTTSSYSSCLSTPNPQAMKQHLIQITKARNSTGSLPETPTISTARRSDADLHLHQHRLSLQINKENSMRVVGGEDSELLPRLSFSKRRCCDENNNYSSKSPSNLARQIVKQVKESVSSRKVGQDITNLRVGGRKDQELLLTNNFKGKQKSNNKTTLDESNSSSPRLRFMDTNKHNTQQQPQLPRVLTRPKPPHQALMAEDQKEFLLQNQNQNQKSPSLSVPKSKKLCSNEKFSSTMKKPPQTSDIIRNKQEEPFIIRPTSSPGCDMKNASKSKRTHHPLSSNLLNNINTVVPNLFPIKTEPSPPPATKITNQKQSRRQQGSKLGSSQQLYSCLSPMYKQQGIKTTLSSTQEKISSSSNNIIKFNINIEDKPQQQHHHTPEFQYITGILSRTTTTSRVTLSQTWFSPNHPIDPSIFDLLEQHQNSKDRIFSMKNQLGHRWNRKLMFDLVDEVLMEILTTRNSEKSKLWFLNRCGYQGTIEGLIGRVWERIGKFPCKKCEFLEDIDGLIEAEDMEKTKVEGEEGLEGEGEWLVAEIEGNIWDTLVHETVLVMGPCESTGKWGP